MPTPSLPKNLTNGTTADATDVMSNFNYIAGASGLLKAGLDALNMLPSFAKDNVEPTFSGWKPILFGANTLAASTNKLLLAPGGGGRFETLNTSTAAGFGPYYFDPAQYAAGGRSTKIRVRAVFGCNSVFGGGLNLTAFLAPLVITPGGASSGNTYAPGANVATALLSGAAAGLSHVEGSAVAAPAAGFYSLGCVCSASSGTQLYDVTAVLEVQQT